MWGWIDFNRSLSNSVINKIWNGQLTSSLALSSRCKWNGLIIVLNFLWAICPTQRSNVCACAPSTTMYWWWMVVLSGCQMCHTSNKQPLKVVTVFWRRTTFGESTGYQYLNNFCVRKVSSFPFPSLLLKGCMACRRLKLIPSRMPDDWSLCSSAHTAYPWSTLDPTKHLVQANGYSTAIFLYQNPALTSVSLKFPWTMNGASFWFSRQSRLMWGSVGNEKNLLMILKEN